MPAKDDKKSKKEEEKPVMKDAKQQQNQAKQGTVKQQEREQQMQKAYKSDRSKDNKNKGSNNKKKGGGGENKENEGTQSRMVTCGTQSSAKGSRQPPPKEKEEEPEKDKESEKEEKKDDKKSQPEKKSQNQIFSDELEKLKKKLEEEGKKIEKPERKDFTPYTFTTLAPYLDVHAAEYLLNYDPAEADLTNTSRSTAFGMTDPWDDYKMDTPESKTEKKKKKKKEENSKEEKKGDERPPKEGSTRLPKFPVVSLEGTDLNRKMDYSEVPKLREEIRGKYSQNAETKITEEYTRTKQDFFRMELDKMEEIAPVNRPHMRAAYFAYLQNNPGSRKAIYECLKDMAEKSRENGQEEHEDGASTSRSHKSQRSQKSEKASVKGSDER